MEDAGSCITKLSTLISKKSSYIDLKLYENSIRDGALIGDTIITLLDLNLSLPPQPDMKPLVIEKV